MSKRISTVILSGASLAALTAAIPAAAQERGLMTDEILITAQKREEIARDVPISVTAYGRDFLETVGINDIEELSEFVPGLNVQLQSPNNPAYVIRGITSDEGSTQQPPRVSVYYNGVDISRSRGSTFEAFDIERVEVVKGPQATLFGTAALAGAISVTTGQPQEEFEAEVYAGYGDYDYQKFGGYVTGGNDLMQARLAAQYRKRDGYVENLAPGQDDLQGVGVFGLRKSLRFTPTDNVTSDLIFTFETHDAPATAFKSGVIAPPGGDTSPFSPAYLSGPFDNNTGGSGDLTQGALRYEGITNFGALGGLVPFPTTLRADEVAAHLGSDELSFERDVYDISSTTEWQINDKWTSTLVLGYRDYENLEVFDADGSVVPLLDIAENSFGNQFTAELRFNIDNNERLNSVFGVNYFYEDAERRLPQVIDEAVFLSCIVLDDGAFDINLPGCVGGDGFPLQQNFNPATSAMFPTIPAASSPGIYYPIEFVDIAENRAYSAFADFTIDITDRLEFTFGARYIYEEREGALSSDVPSSFLIEGLLLPDVELFNQNLPFVAPFITAPFTDDFLAANFEAIVTGSLTSEQLPGLSAAQLQILNEDILQATFINPQNGLPFGSTALLQGFTNTNGQFSNTAIDDDDILPRFNLLYRLTDDVNLYATVAKGRRSPVVTYSQSEPFQPFFLDAETMWNYEAGFKGAFFDNRIQAEGSYFYQDYTNFTVSEIDITSGERPLTLTGAVNQGIELSVIGNVLEGLDAGTTFAWIDSEIEDDPANEQFAGKRFRLQPEYSGSVFFDYSRPITEAFSGFLTTTYSYRSQVFFEADNEPIDGIPIEEDDVHLVDLRLGIESQEYGWELSGFVQNLTDAEYVVDGGNTGGSLGIPTFIAGPPRLWGVEVRKRF